MSYSLENKIKDVKGVSCVNHCVSVPHAQSVSSVAPSLAVGGRLQRFGQKWLDLGANPRVVSILRAGYTLPFKMRPPLTRSPVVLSGYANPCQEPALKGGIASSNAKVGSGKSGCQVLPSFLQPAIPSTQTKQQVDTDFGLKSAESVSLSRNFQNGDPGNNPAVSAERGVGNIAGFQRRILSHPNTTMVKKCLRFCL